MSMTNCKKEQKIPCRELLPAEDFLFSFTASDHAHTVFPAAGRCLCLCVLAVEDLRSRLDEQDGTDHGQQGLGEHIAAVVHQTVGPCAQTIAQVAPDEDAGQEAAQKAQETSQRRTNGHADHPVFERTGKKFGRAQSHKCQNVVQQHFTGKVEHRGCRRRIEAHDHLQAAVDKAGEQPPLDAVAEGHQHKGQHTQQRDAAAVGHGKDLDVGQHHADRDHQSAFHHDAGLGISFGHRDSSSPINSTQKQNAPAVGSRRTGRL